MADSFIQVAPDSTGKQLQTYLNTISAQPVHAEAVVLVDSSGNPITTLPVSGPLTDTQLRATAVPVIGTFFQATQPVSGPITNAELRASGVAVTGTFFQATQPVSGSVTATGPITNAELRAASVAVTGPMTNVELRASPVSVTGPMTNAELRASAVAVTGTFFQSIQPVSGTVNAAQNGTWNITTITNPVTVTGTVTANAGTYFNLGGTLMANGQVAATNVAATLVAARATRRSVTLRNLDLTNSGYVGLPVIATTNGMLVQALESISVDYTGLIQVITATGTTANFAYLETYDA